MKILDTFWGEVSKLVEGDSVRSDTAPTYADVRLPADPAERSFAAPASKKSSTPAPAPTYEGIEA
jgi:hypothetical protein